MDTIRVNAERMARLFEQMRHLGPKAAFAQLKELNLSFSHLRALQLLAPDHLRSMKDLAEQLELTPPSVTAVARRLEQTGFVQRTPHPEDSRVVLLSLTPAGQTFQRRLSEERVAQMAYLLQGLTEAEQQQFLDLLERAVRTMRNDAQHDNVDGTLAGSKRSH